MEGCRQSDCVLLGGETAEMPGFYSPGEYDLAGFAVGSVKQDQVIDGKRIQVRCRVERRGGAGWWAAAAAPQAATALQVCLALAYRSQRPDRSPLPPPRPCLQAGDAILGLASSGVHSNGFSLVRKVLEVRGDGTDGSRSAWSACSHLPPASCLPPCATLRALPCCRQASPAFSTCFPPHPCAPQVSGTSLHDTAPWDPSTSVGLSLLTPTVLYVRDCMKLVSCWGGWVGGRGMAGQTGWPDGRRKEGKQVRVLPPSPDPAASAPASPPRPRRWPPPTCAAWCT